MFFQLCIWDSAEIEYDEEILKFKARISGCKEVKSAKKVYAGKELKLF